MDNDLKNKSKEEIMKFALGELKKTIENLKSGKSSNVSSDLKKMFQMLNEGYAMMENKKITEEDMDNVLVEAAKKVSKKSGEE